ncbi:uncharacterized protein LOC133179473 [Saccostrea echinata]|uniref:uncharacterized protein LOC133179473 n=1 Tax=Saccostrea echinata TaxID=191078 RepID=UPI002A81DBC2|nr:uncharacterized protein LOC133179473 [Saccostrea echinata]
MASTYLYLLIVMVLFYLNTVKGQNLCTRNQTVCWMSDITYFCIPSSHRCDGDRDCPDGSDEEGCGDTVRYCHCLYLWECGLDDCINGCQTGWEGYKCAFKERNKASTRIHTAQTTTSQTKDDTSCHCEDQSMCDDYTRSRSCYCQEGWTGSRCSLKIKTAIEDSLPMIGGAVVIFFVVSACVIIAGCYNRDRIRRGIRRDGWPYRGLTNSQESVSGSSPSSRSHRLASAPPSYDDVVNQGQERNSSPVFIVLSLENESSSSNGENSNEPPPPSYESIIKEQEREGNQLQRDPVHSDICNEQSDANSESIVPRVQNQNQTESELPNQQNTENTNTADVAIM